MIVAFVAEVLLPVVVEGAADVPPPVDDVDGAATGASGENPETMSAEERKNNFLFMGSATSCHAI